MKKLFVGGLSWNSTEDGNATVGDDDARHAQYPKNIQATGRPVGRGHIVIADQQDDRHPFVGQPLDAAGKLPLKGGVRPLIFVGVAGKNTGVNHPLRFGADQFVPANLYCLGPFSLVAQGQARDAHKIGFPLNPARIGGDEFAIILIETNLSVAQEISIRLQSALKENCNITASTGCTIFSQGMSVKDFVAEADKTLYRDKHGKKMNPRH